MSTYQDIYQRSLTSPEGFWAEAAQGIDWIKPWDNVIDNEAKPDPKWFAGAELNTCYSCLHCHVENGLGDQGALIYLWLMCRTDDVINVAGHRLARLPKTRSGKILRAAMVKIADGTEWIMPATIGDPAIMGETAESLKTLGYAKTNIGEKDEY